MVPPAARRVRLLSKEAMPQARRRGDARGRPPYTRFALKPRLTWLFENSLLPKEIELLADSIREDANDGVHNARRGYPLRQRVAGASLRYIPASSYITTTSCCTE